MRRRPLWLSLAVLVALLGAPTTAWARTGSAFTGVYASSAWQHYDSVPQMHGTLRSSDGTPLKSRTVWLYCNGERVSSKVTDSRGRVSFRLALRNNDLQASWYLRYLGSSTYHASRSARVTTRVDLHFLGVGMLPTRDAGTGEWVITFRIRLHAGSEYWLYTTKSTWREVRQVGADGVLHRTADAVQGDAFTAPAEAYYDVRLRCAGEDLTSVLLF